MAKGPVTKEKDRGYKKIMAEMQKLKAKPYVKIGYPEKSEKKDEAKRYKIRNENGDVMGILENEELTVLDVAIFSEFGTSFTPERPFIRASHDANLKEMKTFLKKLYNHIMSGKMTVEKALDNLGLKAETNLKKYMSEGKVKPVSARAAREGGKTLVDTAQLMNSVTSVKVMKGKK